MYRLFGIFLIGLFGCLLPAVGQDARGKYNFNAEWLLHVGDDPQAREVRFDDQGWKQVTLPRPFNEDEAFRLSIEQLTDTVVWYRKHFRLPAGSRGKKVLSSSKACAREPTSTSTATASVCTRTERWRSVST